MSRRTSILGAVLAVVLLGGCVSMPVDGPVEERTSEVEGEATPGVSFDPRGPEAGQSPTEIVDGFLEAMKATPIRTTVAAQFLTRSAREEWAPQRRVVTYAGKGAPEGGNRLRVELSDVDVYDDRGAWQGQHPSRTIALVVAQEDGEWRIEELPDALIVPTSWFQDWYQRMATYYFDPTAGILVPEPVFVPRGDQTASALVRSLLTPPEFGASVVRSFFPAGTNPGLSVPVSPAGVAEVSLAADPAVIDQRSAELMLTQLVWTLRQVPRVRAVEVRIGGRAVAVDGESQVSLDFGSGFDPAGIRRSGDLWGLQDGMVVRGSLGDMRPLPGSLGEAPAGIRSVAGGLDGTSIAAVSTDGTALLVGTTDEGLTPVLSGAVDLRKPVWDHLGRLWALDHNRASARVFLVVGQDAREIEVPGLSGRTVSEILVSRDGTRLLAVVRGPTKDRLLSLRIEQDNEGHVSGVVDPRWIDFAVEGSPRLRDVAWRSPMAVSVLSGNTGNLSQVRTVLVDGAPGEVAVGGVARLRGRIRSLVSSPVEGADAYALGGRTIVDVSRPERFLEALPRGLRALTYPG